MAARLWPFGKNIHVHLTDSPCLSRQKLPTSAWELRDFVGKQKNPLTTCSRKKHLAYWPYLVQLSNGGIMVLFQFSHMFISYINVTSADEHLILTQREY